MKKINIGILFRIIYFGNNLKIKSINRRSKLLTFFFCVPIFFLFFTLFFDNNQDYTVEFLAFKRLKFDSSFFLQFVKPQSL